jgi:acyl-CoA thioesterase-1
MQVPPNYGQRLLPTGLPRPVLATVAKSRKTALVPFMLKGVADVPDAQRLFQSDRIHPNEDGTPHHAGTMSGRPCKKLIP